METISKSYLSLSKIGSTALGALHGLWADQKRKDGRKSFGIVMCPSHVTQKWVREIGETLPDTYGMVVRTIRDLNRLYAMYEEGDKSVFAVFSKEQARDGYAVRYEGHTDLAPYEFFECCNEKSDDEILGAAVQHYDVVEIDDGIKPAFFYKTEHGYELLFSFDAKTAKKNIREEID